MRKKQLIAVIQGTIITYNIMNHTLLGLRKIYMHTYKRERESEWQCEGVRVRKLASKEREKNSVCVCEREREREKGITELGYASHPLSKS